MEQEPRPPTDFVTVAQVTDIAPGTGRTVEIKGVWIALFNVDGRFYAIDNACPHAGGPLGDGKLREGGVVECPWHGWRFSVATGRRVGNPNFEVPCCAVRVVGNEVQIALPPELKAV
jgi:nitrite reductase (NADH) small subunit/3-phenylpropionate/trans-cinnamate dioxygenase ferredoxin subunit